MFLSVCSEDSTVYIGSHSHLFAALSLRSGVALWQTVLGDRIESSAALSLCRSLLIVGEQSLALSTLSHQLFSSIQFINLLLLFLCLCYPCCE